MTDPEAALAKDRLETRLADAKPDYSAGEAVAEANRCLYCHDAPCVTACPTGIDIPSFIHKIGTGNLRGAARTILSANLLGYSCARVCPVEVLCVGACVYNHWDRQPPIAIGRLQRHAVEAAWERGDAAALLPRAAGSAHRVACVGAGPASLACAGYLALEGCAVTIFERRDLPGGLNSTGVAPYKMPVPDALAEVEFIRSLGVEIRCGVEVGGDLTIETLLAEHDAVFVAPGLGPDTALALPGADGPGVVGATAWIEAMKLAPGASVEHVNAAVVIGGGNTALDVARELAALGVAEVHMLYRRTADRMSGYAHELAHAREEGVRLVERAQPARFEREAGRLVAVTLADGRRYPCDLAVVAIGQSALESWCTALPGVTLGEDGRIAVDPASGATGHPKIWAGGDCTGGELVVTAVQDGKRAARSIARALGLPERVDAPLRAGH